MARVLIFDSKSRYTVKSDDTLIGSQCTLGEALGVSTAKRSNPVRCFNVAEEQRVVGVEWLLDEINELETYAFRWWPEYFSDHESLALPPNERVWKDVNVAYPWGRAMVANDGGGGNIDLNALVYRMTMYNRLGNASLFSDCLYIPLSVHALWMRVAVYCDIAAGTASQDQLAAARLRAFAHVGGHSELTYLEENGDKIYAYNSNK